MSDKGTLTDSIKNLYDQWIYEIECDRSYEWWDEAWDRLNFKYDKAVEAAEKLEREIRQLEVAIYDLKTENNLLYKAVDQVIDDRDAYHNEDAELRKDKDRLDWILSDADRRDMGLVLYRDYPLETREDIDKAMEESQ